MLPGYKDTMKNLPPFRLLPLILFLVIGLTFSSEYMDGIYAPKKNEFIYENITRRSDPPIISIPMVERDRNNSFAISLQLDNQTQIMEFGNLLSSRTTASNEMENDSEWIESIVGGVIATVTSLSILYLSGIHQWVDASHSAIIW